MLLKRVAVTGLGLVSPYGGDLNDFFARLCAGESAIRFLKTEDLPLPLAMPFCDCFGFDANAALGRPLASMMDRFAHLGMAAVFAAWEDCGLPRKVEGNARENWGVSWGSALGGSLACEKAYRDLWQNGRERISPMTVLFGMSNAANAHISIALGLGGVSINHSVACASSAIAIGEAFRRVRSGEATVMVAGGSEATQAYGGARAWEALRVVAPGDVDTSGTACRPFASDRKGLVLGEGAAALVLEDMDHALARGARIHGEILGYASNCDHSHMVRPHVAGQVRVLKATLADARLSTADIGYVNAHGTATAEGDTVEITALREVFGEHAASLPVSATKSMHGHLLGAAGAVEALITVLALREQALPPTAHLRGRIDQACMGVDHIEAARTDMRIRSALSNSFAFGGSNAVLAFGVPPENQRSGLGRIPA